jgi:hypothetical protein
MTVGMADIMVGTTAGTMAAAGITTIIITTIVIIPMPQAEDQAVMEYVPQAAATHISPEVQRVQAATTPVRVMFPVHRAQIPVRLPYRVRQTLHV